MRSSSGRSSSRHKGSTSWSARASCTRCSRESAMSTCTRPASNLEMGCLFEELIQALIDHIDRERSGTLRPQALGKHFDDFLRGKEPLVIDGALDAGKASADFFKGVLDDDDFRARTHSSP